MRQVEVKALLVDPEERTPLVILNDLVSEMIIPIWIGNAEATSIAIAMQKRNSHAL
ncbi:bifunctional nuclease family protein [Candidatus Acetothermia bacterium]|nr:bifunctional nuclease family protein [Candidatus Acetothermia bacterium]MBI3644240.1 bifunctional nuclease family protein [Candidatus Acetothermia bacterium]